MSLWKRTLNMLKRGCRGHVLGPSVCILTSEVSTVPMCAPGTPEGLYLVLTPGSSLRISEG